MSTKIYGYWLLACGIAMLLFVIGAAITENPAVLLGVQGSVCLMLLGRCFWRKDRK